MGSLPLPSIPSFPSEGIHLLSNVQRCSVLVSFWHHASRVICKGTHVGIKTHQQLSFNREVEKKMLKNEIQKKNKKKNTTPDSFEKTCRKRMQIVTWPWGKAALNIIKRRQQKKARRHDTGNVFSLLVSSGRSGMIECWCLPGLLQRRSSTPPSAHTHIYTHAQLFSWCTLTYVNVRTHTHTLRFSCYQSDKNIKVY